MRAFTGASGETDGLIAPISSRACYGVGDQSFLAVPSVNARPRTGGGTPARAGARAGHRLEPRQASGEASEALRISTRAAGAAGGAGSKHQRFAQKADARQAGGLWPALGAVCRSQAGAAEISSGESICVRFQGKLRRFSRRASQVHGVGLFVEEHLKAGEVLGYFTGELLSRRVGEERRRRGAKSIVEYDMGEEGRVFIDASRGRVSPFQWINSVAGSSAPPNVQFAVVDERLCVETRMAVDKGEELLADYSVGK